jgi:23S rRNA pseudouridine2605 synthase
MAMERVQKLIARAGVCSRRDAEERIREGRVTINGRVAALGDQADPATDAIKVDGKRLKAEAPARYLLLNKPAGVVTTTEDPEGRTTVIDLIRPKVGGRLFPVGRLDYASEGLVLLTNDGDLALRVSHPRYGVPREYLVKVRGVPSEGERGRLAAGTVIEGQKVVPQEVSQVRVTATGVNSWWKVVVGEGKTHEVREMFKRIGHPVQRLIRVAIGPLRDGELKPGAFRDLSGAEVDLLRRGVRLGGRPDGRTTGSRVHSQARRVRAGEADRGGAAGARGRRHRQAGVEREPARDVAEGARRDPRRAS